MTESRSDIHGLQEFDTPTVCNALEMIDPAWRSRGYTKENFFAVNSAIGPVAGVAFTATMRSACPSDRTVEELRAHRLEYYEYVSQDVGVPKICVMQDVDGADSGRGPFWGEFNTRVHLSLGFDGIVTDGGVRDISKLPTEILILAKGARPSHAYVHVVAFGGQVNVSGMTVSHGDIVHVDQHGAVAFPRRLVPEVIIRAEEFVASEAPIIEACKRGPLSFAELRELYLGRGK